VGGIRAHEKRQRLERASAGLEARIWREGLAVKVTPFVKDCLKTKWPNEPKEDLALLAGMLAWATPRSLYSFGWEVRDLKILRVALTFADFYASYQSRADLLNTARMQWLVDRTRPAYAARTYRTNAYTMVEWAQGFDVDRMRNPLWLTNAEMRAISDQETAYGFARRANVSMKAACGFISGGGEPRSVHLHPRPPFMSKKSARSLEVLSIECSSGSGGPDKHKLYTQYRVTKTAYPTGRRQNPYPKETMWP